jgi:ABC-type dipeptide/oligopeptide/nickel transport system permease subunit
MATANTSTTLTTSRSLPARLWETQRRVRALKLPWIPITVLAVLIISAVFAPLIAPHDPREIDVLKGVQRVAPFQTLENPLGVDLLGRDMLSRLIYGARISAFISLTSLGFGALIGTALGIASGYFGGKTDAFIMRVCDAVMASQPCYWP